MALEQRALEGNPKKDVRPGGYSLGFRMTNLGSCLSERRWLLGLPMYCKWVSGRRA